jgi:hypothetical protein
MLLRDRSRIDTICIESNKNWAPKSPPSPQTSIRSYTLRHLVKRTSPSKHKRCKEQCNREPLLSHHHNRLSCRLAGTSTKCEPLNSVFRPLRMEQRTHLTSSNRHLKLRTECQLKAIFSSLPVHLERDHRPGLTRTLIRRGEGSRLRLVYAFVTGLIMTDTL